jgi:transposase
MFLFPSQFKFYLYNQPTDMRKSFDGLFGIIKASLKLDPLSGDVYVFMNKRRNRIKLLCWGGDGFWIFYKRLEKGTFQRPAEKSEKVTACLLYDELVMLLDGIDLKSIKRRQRYQLRQ